MNLAGRVVEGEQFCEMCVRTERDKYLILSFYYIWCLKKNWLNLYHMFNVSRRWQKLIMNIGSLNVVE